MECIMIPNASNNSVDSLVSNGCQNPSFPAEIYHKIFSYIADPHDLLRIERACKEFFAIVRADDSIWDSIGAMMDVGRLQYWEGASMRHRVFGMWAARQVRRYQRYEENTIYGTVGYDRFKEAIQALFRPQTPSLAEASSVTFRRDTLWLVLEIVEHHLIALLAKAMQVTAAMGTTARHRFRFVDEASLRGTDFHLPRRFYYDLLRHSTKFVSQEIIEENVVNFQEILRRDDLSFRVIRKVAFRAGVLEMTFPSFQHMESMFFQWTVQLLDGAHVRAQHVALESLIHTSPRDWSCCDDEPLDWVNAMPPATIRGTLPGPRPVHFVVIPGFVADEAKFQRIPPSCDGFYVGDDCWPSDTPLLEKQAAFARYMEDTGFEVRDNHDDFSVDWSESMEDSTCSSMTDIANAMLLNSLDDGEDYEAVDELSTYFIEAGDDEESDDLEWHETHT